MLLDSFLVGKGFVTNRTLTGFRLDNGIGEGMLHHVVHQLSLGGKFALTGRTNMVYDLFIRRVRVVFQLVDSKYGLRFETHLTNVAIEIPEIQTIL